MIGCISCALTIITFIAYLRTKYNPLWLYVCEVCVGSGWGRWFRGTQMLLPA